MNQTHNHLPEKKVSVPAPTCFQRQKYLKITQNGQKFSVIAPLSRKKFLFFCPRPPHPLHPHHAVISSYTEVNSHAFSPSYRVFRPKNHDFVSHVADRSYVGLYISIANTHGFCTLAHARNFEASMQAHTNAHTHTRTHASTHARTKCSRKHASAHERTHAHTHAR